MKKYLVTGLAAVAISGMFTSCTHETDAGAGGTNLGVVETYEQAFISRFGTPSPDADWGLKLAHVQTHVLFSLNTTLQMMPLPSRQQQKWQVLIS